MLVDREQDHRKAGETAHDVPERRDNVVVERSERAGEEGRGELAEPRDDHPRECRGSGVDCLGRPRAREHVCDRAGGEHADEKHRGRDERDRRRVRDGFRRKPSGSSCPGKRRQQRDPDRGGREREDDEHRVRREEAVRLGRPPELAGDDHADDRGETRLHGDRECRHRARRERPVTG